MKLDDVQQDKALKLVSDRDHFKASAYARKVRLDSIMELLDLTDWLAIEPAVKHLKEEVERLRQWRSSRSPSPPETASDTHEDSPQTALASHRDCDS